MLDFSSPMLKQSIGDKKSNMKNNGCNNHGHNSYVSSSWFPHIFVRSLVLHGTKIRTIKCIKKIVLKNILKER